MGNKLLFNLNEIPMELNFILDLFKLEEKWLVEKWEQSQKNIDWDKFLELAFHHRLYPIIVSKKRVLDRLVPVKISDALQQQYQKNIFRMLHLSGEMAYVNSVFQENGVENLFLKGPTLAIELYGDISLRTSNDIDMIVPFNKLERVEDILIQLGYEKKEYIKSVLNDWVWRHYHFIYIHSEKNIKLEIHWRLHPGPGEEPSFEELWKRRKKSTLTNSPIYLLSKEDLFLYLVSHGARHGWSRLRWLVDIHQLMQQDIDWNTVKSLFKKYDNPHVAGQAIILASQLLGTRVPPEANPITLGQKPNKLAHAVHFYLEKMINLHDEPLAADVSSYHKHYLYSLMSTNQKIIFMLSFLFPYPEDAEILPLPKKLHVLYFPLRPFLWAWRKATKQVIT